MYERGGRLASKDLRVNEQIRVREVRLIDDDGEQHGIIPTTQALSLAQERGLDLVEIAPQAKPPVCKFLDYGKFKFEQDKKDRESRKKQKQVKLKEVRMQPKIEEHDLQFKTNHIRGFLADGFKVKVTIRFRGREMAHTELGRVVLDKIIDMLGDTAVTDRPPQMEGRFMSMIVSPGTKKAPKNNEQSATEE